jgi:hypothetical protein
MRRGSWRDPGDCGSAEEAWLVLWLFVGIDGVWCTMNVRID